MSTETTPVDRHRFPSLVAKAALLTPVTQWLYLVAMSLFSDSSKIGCTNWHGEMFRCSLVEMLIENVYNVILLNVFTLGLALVIAFMMSLAMVFAFQVFVPDAVARSKGFWIGIASALLIIVVGRVVKTTEFSTALHEEKVTPEAPIMLLRGSGGATTVDPGISPLVEPGSPPAWRADCGSTEPERLDWTTSGDPGQCSE